MGRLALCHKALRLIFADLEGAHFWWALPLLLFLLASRLLPSIRFSSCGRHPAPSHLPHKSIPRHFNAEQSRTSNGEERK